MTSEFKLTDAFFKDLRFKVLRLTVPLMLIAVSVGWYLSGVELDSFGLISFGLFLAVIMPFTISRTLRQQSKSYRTFRIELAKDRIIRKQDGLPPLEIEFSEITSLHEVGDKGILIRGNSPNQVLSLPATLERYDELRTQLAKISSLERQPAKNTIPRFVAASLLPLVLMVALYRAESAAVVVTSGVLLVGTLAYCGVSIARSPYLDQRVKRSSWAIVLVIISVVARMWFVLRQR